MTNKERLSKLEQAKKLIREVEFSYPLDSAPRSELYRLVVETFGIGSFLESAIKVFEKEISEKEE